MRTFIAVCAAAMLTVTGAAAVAQSGAGPYAAAFADAKRPAADKERDARSHAAEILAFAEVKPGAHVADLVTGGGYYARLFAAAVGPNGKVFAWEPAEFIAFNAEYGKGVKELPTQYANVTGSDAKFGELALPAGLDVVLTNQNYHDFHLKPVGEGVAKRMNEAAFKALKPGGVYIVVDHSAAAGAELGVADTLHRIDAERVKQEVTAAGFRFEGETDVLRNPADPRTASVFDPAIRGKTDQFVLKFRKPR